MNKKVKELLSIQYWCYFWDLFFKTSVNASGGHNAKAAAIYAFHHIDYIRIKSYSCFFSLYAMPRS